MRYNVFISWSGRLGKSAALLVHEWLPSVIQVADPFMSDKDIDAGAPGLEEIDEQLKELRTGVICVTGENQASAWINYEAGALSKVIDKTYVIPLALDLEKGQIKNPLGRLQAMLPIEEDMRHLVATINRALGEPLRETQLVKAFNLAWPSFHSRMERQMSEHAQQSFTNNEPKRSLEDMLEELIVSVRDQSRLISAVRHTTGLPATMNAQLLVTESALAKLGGVYGLQRIMSIKELRAREEGLDAEGWRLIETSPFLVWYLETYLGISRPAALAEENDGSMDDVPF